jgi:hypothetical protein
MNLSGFLLRPDLFIQPGLFYWWIMNEQDWGFSEGYLDASSGFTGD